MITRFVFAMTTSDVSSARSGLTSALSTGLFVRVEELHVEQEPEIVPHLGGIDLAARHAEPGLQVPVARVSPVAERAISDVEVHGKLLHEGNGFLRGFPQKGKVGEVRQDSEIA